RAVQLRGVARLPDNPVAPCRIDRPQNRPDVVRILDLIEHDDERRARRLPDEILDAQVHAVVHVGDDTLMRATLREPIELVRVGTANRNPLLLGQAHDLREALVRPRRDAYRGDALRPQRFDDGGNAVNAQWRWRMPPHVRGSRESWEGPRRAAAPPRDRSPGRRDQAPDLRPGRSAPRGLDGTAPYPLAPPAPCHGSRSREISRGPAEAPKRSPRRAPPRPHAPRRSASRRGRAGRRASARRHSRRARRGAPAPDSSDRPTRWPSPSTWRETPGPERSASSGSRRR